MSVPATTRNTTCSFTPIPAPSHQFRTALSCVLDLHPVSEPPAPCSRTPLHTRLGQPAFPAQAGHAEEGTSGKPGTVSFSPLHPVHHYRCRIATPPALPDWRSPEQPPPIATSPGQLLA
ncbi:unnamed protein product [Lampetra fluviatilis]